MPQMIAGRMRFPISDAASDDEYHGQVCAVAEYQVDGHAAIELELAIAKWQEKQRERHQGGGIDSPGDQAGYERAPCGLAGGGRGRKKSPPDFGRAKIEN